MKTQITRVTAKPLSIAARKKMAADAKRMARLSTSELLALSRTMTSDEQKQWDRVRRGRPRKPAGQKAVRVLFTIEPALLAKVDRFARTHKLTRAELIADGLRRAMSA